jgi:hypothetical protein
MTAPTAVPSSSRCPGSASLSWFGFALLSAPLLTATIGAPEAVPTITITGIPCNVADLVVLNHLRAGTR